MVGWWGGVGGGEGKSAAWFREVPCFILNNKQILGGGGNKQMNNNKQYVIQTFRRNLCTNIIVTLDVHHIVSFF